MSERGIYLITIARIKIGEKVTDISLETFAKNESDARRKGWLYCSVLNAKHPEIKHAVIKIEKK